MPCRSVEYPKQSKIEIEIIKTLYIQDELMGKEITLVYTHPRLDTQELSQENLNRLTKEICETIRARQKVHEFSFYLQEWWLEHQISDHIHLHEEFNSATNPDYFYRELNDFDKNLFDLPSFVKGLLDHHIKATNYKLNALKSEPNKDRISHIHSLQFLNIITLLTDCFIRIASKKIKLDESKISFSVEEINGFFLDHFDINIQVLLPLELYNHLEDSVKRLNLCNREKGNMPLFTSSLNYYFQKNNLSIITESYIKKLVLILEEFISSKEIIG